MTGRAIRPPDTLFLRALPTLSVRWRTIGIWLLVAAAGVNHYTIKVAGLSVYPENIALGIVGLLVALATLRAQFNWYVPGALLPLLAWLFVALIASIINAPNQTHSLILWNKLLFVVVTFVLAANLTRGNLLTATSAQLGVAVGVAASGLLAQGAWQVLGIELGTQPAPDGSRVAYGTQLEANILGSYSLAALLLALVIAFSTAAVPRRLRTLSWVAAVACALALVISVTRAAWLGLAVALVVVGAVKVLGRPQVVLRWGVVMGLALGIALMAFLVLDPHSFLPQLDPYSGPILLRRLASFGDLARDGNLWVRSEVMRNALAFWRQHLLIGWGVGAYGDMFRDPNQDLPGWIPNLFVHHLFDSGLIGLTCLCTAFAVVVWNGVRAFRRAHGIRRSLLAGPLLSLLGLLIAFQATEATWLAYPWIYLGMLEGITRQSQYYE